MDLGRVMSRVRRYGRVIPRRDAVRAMPRTCKQTAFVFVPSVIS